MRPVVTRRALPRQLGQSFDERWSSTKFRLAAARDHSTLGPWSMIQVDRQQAFGRSGCARGLTLDRDRDHEGPKASSDWAACAAAREEPRMASFPRRLALLPGL